MCYEHIYIFIFIFPCNIRMGNELIAWRDGSWRKNRVEQNRFFSGGRAQGEGYETHVAFYASPF